MVLSNQVPNTSLEDDLQWNADTGRLLKIALRNHDVVSFEAVFKRMADKLGYYRTQNLVFAMITHLMNTENWSWELSDGSASPLI